MGQDGKIRESNRQRQLEKPIGETLEESIHVGDLDKTENYSGLSEDYDFEKELEADFKAEKRLLWAEVLLVVVIGFVALLRELFVGGFFD